MTDAPPAGRTLSVTPRGVAGSLLVLVVAAVCVRLGFWQLDRLAQRRDRNARVQERIEAPAVALTTSPHDTAGWLYRRATIDGAWDHRRSIIMPGRAFRGTPGAHVLTPVILDDGTAVLVDRGWVPAADGATVDLDRLVPDSTISGSALLLPFPGEEPNRRAAPATAAPAASGEFRRVWFAIDEAALRSQFPYTLAPVHAQLLPDGKTGYPLRAELPVFDEGPHMGYAIQWFAFAIIAIGGWIAMVLKSGVARPGNAPP